MNKNLLPAQRLSDGARWGLIRGASLASCIYTVALGVWWWRGQGWHTDPWFVSVLLLLLPVSAALWIYARTRSLQSGRRRTVHWVTGACTLSIFVICTSVQVLEICPHGEPGYWYVGVALLVPPVPGIAVAMTVSRRAPSCSSLALGVATAASAALLFLHLHHLSYLLAAVMCAR